MSIAWCEPLPDFDHCAHTPHSPRFEYTLFQPSFMHIGYHENQLRWHIVLKIYSIWQRKRASAIYHITSISLHVYLRLIFLFLCLPPRLFGIKHVISSSSQDLPSFASYCLLTSSRNLREPRTSHYFDQFARNTNPPPPINQSSPPLRRPPPPSLNHHHHHHHILRPYPATSPPLTPSSIDPANPAL